MNKEIENETIYAVGTLRVSSTKQGLQGDSHKQQRERIEQRVKQLSSILGKTIVVKKWFKLTESASGSIDMQPVNKVIEYCSNPKNNIKYFFFKSVDRMTRGGSVIYGLLRSRLSKAGVECVDAYGVVSYKQTNTLEHLNIEYDWSVFNPSWTTEMLESERAHQEVRDILTRMIGAEIDYVRMGYRVRQAPPGYKNKKIKTIHGTRVVLVPHKIESPWFIKMFELREQGNLTDEEIVEEVNKLGFKSRRFNRYDKENKKKVIAIGGGNPLTVKQLQRYIKNPIYAGINTEKWTQDKPVKLNKSESLVSIKTFNRANKSKWTIIETEEGFKVHEGKPDLWKMRRLKNNPDYPYKQYVLCHICGKPVLGSASRSKSGRHIPRYHCSRGHKYWSVNTNEFNKTVEQFVKKLKFSDSYLKRFNKVVLEEWQKRKESVQDDSISSEKRVLKLKEEQKVITEKIKMLSSAVAIKAMEKDLDRLEAEIADAMQIRDRNEDKVFDIQTLMNYCTYFMEHLDNLVLGAENPLKNAAMFNLLFDEKPTYEELLNGTPNLAHVFKLNQQPTLSKSQMVTPRGIEPLFSG